MRRSSATPEVCYAKITKALLASPGVSLGAAGKGGFGAGALSVQTRIFALLSSRSHFVVKLPRPRVDELVAAGKGTRFDPGHGRLMKEWLQVEDTLQGDWLALAKEAKAFVASLA
jgi:hypothetical protein